MADLQPITAPKGLKGFQGGDLMYIRQVDKLNSKSKRQKRVLVITPKTFVVCDKSQQVKRFFNIEQLKEIQWQDFPRKEGGIEKKILVKIHGDLEHDLVWAQTNDPVNPSGSSSQDREFLERIPAVYLARTGEELPVREVPPPVDLFEEAENKKKPGFEEMMDEKLEEIQKRAKKKPRSPSSPVSQDATEEDPQEEEAPPPPEGEPEDEDEEEGEPEEHRGSGHHRDSPPPDIPEGIAQVDSWVEGTDPSGTMLGPRLGGGQDAGEATMPANTMEELMKSFGPHVMAQMAATLTGSHGSYPGGRSPSHMQRQPSLTGQSVHSLSSVVPSQAGSRPSMSPHRGRQQSRGRSQSTAHRGGSNSPARSLTHAASRRSVAFDSRPNYSAPPSETGGSVPPSPPPGSPLRPSASRRSLDPDTRAVLASQMQAQQEQMARLEELILAASVDQAQQRGGHDETPREHPAPEQLGSIQRQLEALTQGMMTLQQQLAQQQLVQEQQQQRLLLQQAASPQQLSPQHHSPHQQSPQHQPPHQQSPPQHRPPGAPAAAPNEGESPGRRDSRHPAAGAVPMAHARPHPQQAQRSPSPRSAPGQGFALPHDQLQAVTHALQLLAQEQECEEADELPPEPAPHLRAMVAMPEHSSGRADPVAIMPAGKYVGPFPADQPTPQFSPRRSAPPLQITQGSDAGFAPQYSTPDAATARVVEELLRHMQRAPPGGCAAAAGPPPDAAPHSRAPAAWAAPPARVADDLPPPASASEWVAQEGPGSLSEWGASVFSPQHSRSPAPRLPAVPPGVQLRPGVAMPPPQQVAPAPGAAQGPAHILPASTSFDEVLRRAQRATLRAHIASSQPPPPPQAPLAQQPAAVQCAAERPGARTAAPVAVPAACQEQEGESSELPLPYGSIAAEAVRTPPAQCRALQVYAPQAPPQPPAPDEGSPRLRHSPPPEWPAPQPAPRPTRDAAALADLAEGAELLQQHISKSHADMNNYLSSEIAKLGDLVQLSRGYLGGDGSPSPGGCPEAADPLGSVSGTAVPSPAAAAVRRASGATTQSGGQSSASLPGPYDIDAPRARKRSAPLPDAASPAPARQSPAAAPRRHSRRSVLPPPPAAAAPEPSQGGAVWQSSAALQAALREALSDVVSSTEALSRARALHAADPSALYAVLREYVPTMSERELRTDWEQVVRRYELFAQRMAASPLGRDVPQPRAAPQSWTPQLQAPAAPRAPRDRAPVRTPQHRMPSRSADDSLPPTPPPRPQHDWGRGERGGVSTPAAHQTQQYAVPPLQVLQPPAPAWCGTAPGRQESIGHLLGKPLSLEGLRELRRLAPAAAAAGR